MKPRINPPVPRIARVVAPSSAFAKEVFLAGVRYLEGRGFQVRYQDDIFAQADFLAGEDTRRLKELRGAFADREAPIIFCARGGYGVTRLLPQLRRDQLKRGKKVLVGYSDITALLSYLVFYCGQPAIHGPLVAGGLNDQLPEPVANLLFALLSGPGRSEIPLGGEALVKGVASGLLFGGNLSMLQTLAGMPWAPKLDGAILFVEEVNEKPYRIDRILTHLQQLGWFTKLRGVVIGNLGTGDPEFEREVARRYFVKGKRPVLVGPGLGHHAPGWPLPVGVQADLDAGRGVLKVTHPWGSA